MQTVLAFMDLKSIC